MKEWWFRRLAVHGTPWWVPELRESTQRRRQFIEAYKGRMEELS